MSEGINFEGIYAKGLTSKGLLSDSVIFCTFLSMLDLVNVKKFHGWRPFKLNSNYQNHQ